MALGSTELAAMRSEAESVVLPDSSSVTRNTTSADGYGGLSSSWAEVSTPDCRIDELGAEGSQSLALEFADRLQGRRAAAIHFPYDEDIQEGDRVTVDSVSWEILKVAEGKSWDILLRCVAVELE